MNSSHPTRGKCKAGRPPIYSEAENRRRALDAAERVFTTSGYAAATMEQIARAACMSKKTLYQLYPDKRSLFVAVTVTADDFPWEDEGNTPLDNPCAELRRRLLAAAEFILKSRQLSLTRLLIAEAKHEPELANDFYERVIAGCRGYIIAAVGRVLREDPDKADYDVELVSKILLGATLGGQHLTALFGRSRSPGRTEIAASVDTALQLFGFLCPGRSGRAIGRERAERDEAGCKSATGDRGDHG